MERIISEALAAVPHVLLAGIASLAGIAWWRQRRAGETAFQVSVNAMRGAVDELTKTVSGLVTKVEFTNGLERVKADSFAAIAGVRIELDIVRAKQDAHSRKIAVLSDRSGKPIE